MMSELINDDEFKTPTDKFVQELDALEKYSNKNSDTIARMSLFKQFDPMVNQNVSPRVNHHQTGNNLLEEFVTETNNNSEEINQSATLIHINSPAFKNSPTNDISNTNGVAHIEPNFNDQQIVLLNEEIGLLESRNSALESLVSQLSLINEETVDLSTRKICTLQETVDNCMKEIGKLSDSKNQLSEEINGVEKNYYEIHSRYDNLRSLVKEMDNRESDNKSKLQELTNKLKLKEHECRKWKVHAEEAIET